LNISLQNQELQRILLSRVALMAFETIPKEKTFENSRQKLLSNIFVLPKYSQKKNYIALIKQRFCY